MSSPGVTIASLSSISQYNPYPPVVLENYEEFLEWGGYPNTPTSLQMWSTARSRYLKDDSPQNKIYNIPLLDAFSGRYRSSVKQDGEIGLEIECEGKNLTQGLINYWVTHPDHSLRAFGDHPPVEYVLKAPLSREEIPKALTYLSEKLKASGSEVIESQRTSVHVHLNCQKLTLKQIYQYICLYLIFEERLVEFSGETRAGNLFCLRAKDADHFIQILESAIQTENFNELFSDNLRYASCNTASLGKFGSLEFRSMRGTVDKSLIQLWINILTTLKDKSLEYGDPQEIVDDFQKLGPSQFCKKIFNKSELMPLFSDENWPNRHNSMWDGLRMMRDVAYAVKWEKQDPTLLKKKDKLKSKPSEPEIEAPQVAPTPIQISELVSGLDATMIEQVQVVHPDVYVYWLNNGQIHAYNYANAYRSYDSNGAGSVVIPPRRVIRLFNNLTARAVVRSLNPNEVHPSANPIQD